jgi:drug/metabolite transporter (DMT)-like permease
MGRSAVGDGTSRLGADGLLLTTAFLWGVTFVAQKYAAATMPALAFVAARFAVSAVVLAPFALWEFRRKASPNNKRIAVRGRAAG